MKTRILLTLFLLISISSFAQEGEMSPAKQEKIKSMKIAFITDRVALTPEEAEKFWPIYNEYTAEVEKIQKGKKGTRGPGVYDTIDKLTDKEVEAHIDNSFTAEQQLLDLKKKYYQKYKSILSVKKIAKLYQAEEQFKRELIKKIKGEKAGRPAPGPSHN
jgi:hypothetical protein